MDFKRMSIQELEEINLAELTKEQLEELKEEAETKEFYINMADHLDDGDYRAMARLRAVARKCKEYLGE